VLPDVVPAGTGKCVSLAGAEDCVLHGKEEKRRGPYRRGYERRMFGVGTGKKRARKVIGAVCIVEEGFKKEKGPCQEVEKRDGEIIPLAEKRKEV